MALRFEKATDTNKHYNVNSKATMTHIRIVNSRRGFNLILPFNNMIDRTIPTQRRAAFVNNTQLGYMNKNRLSVKL